MNKKLVASLFLYEKEAITSFEDLTVISKDPVALAKMYSDKHADELIVYDLSMGDKEHEEALDVIKEICEKEGNQFIYSYYPDPDATMHDYGVTSKQAKAVFDDIAQMVENIYRETKDTIFIITADHGQVDIDAWIPLYEDKEIMDMLEIYPYTYQKAKVTLFGFLICLKIC